LPSAAIRSASVRSDRSSSAPPTFAIITGLASSAALIVVPFFSAASRRRSFQSDARVWPRPAQYSGGRPGFSAGAASWSHQGKLHVGRAVVPSAVVVFLLVIGPPVIVAARGLWAFCFRI
jgi:hypothetical protein